MAQEANENATLMNGFGDDISEEQLDELIQKFLNDLDSPKGVTEYGVGCSKTEEPPFLDGQSFFQNLTSENSLVVKMAKPNRSRAVIRLENISDYLCCMCGYKTKKFAMITRHAKVHGKIFRCEHCSYWTRRKAHFQTHTNTHFKNTNNFFLKYMR
ncbi:uncharacterized protein LOC106673988 isoform X2 [Cimex lectularius]|uniref:C2H2-type domain-containing protein n=1 Tax=Cimex lectularius TaxID=79782 RepID=A0A8I6SIC6_CIMLE|nr:uncharacterized protein LOC106673988 isoform X2 [Cimex lectularius]